jgi:multiple sugar transport system ATP-binding protein
MTLADRLALVEAGRLAQTGPPLELYREPCNRFVAGFLGSPRMNFLSGSLQRGGAHRATLRLPGGVAVPVPVADPSIADGREVELGIRPEHLRIVDPPAGTLSGRVSLVEHLGDQSLVYLSWHPDAAPLVLKGDLERLPAIGDALGLDLPMRHCRLFDRGGGALAGAADRPGDA